MDRLERSCMEELAAGAVAAGAAEAVAAHDSRTVLEVAVDRQDHRLHADEEGSHSRVQELGDWVAHRLPSWAQNRDSGSETAVSGRNAVLREFAWHQAIFAARDRRAA